MMEIPIREIDYGLGFTIFEGDRPIYIELNRNLRKYPRLRGQVLSHELLHWNSKGWLDNFKIDFFDMFNFKKQRQLTKFCIKHKRANMCNLPFFIENGKIIPNYFMISFYVVGILGLIGIGALIL